MLNWAKAHPIWATLIGLLVLFLMWRLFAGGGSAQTATVGVVQQDPSVVAAGQQLQAMQYGYQAEALKIQAAAQAQADTNATQIALAQIAAGASQDQLELQGQIAASQTASQERVATLTSTLAAQLEASRIQSTNQQATLAATLEQSRIASQQHSTEMLAQLQSSTTIAIQQSQADLTKAITASQTEVQKQLIQSNQAVAQAQIKASKPKLCFITTACCELQGKPDNCEELTTLRAFRDGWLLSQSFGVHEIATYYRVAPLMLEDIRKRADGDIILMELWGDYIAPCVDLIKSDRNQEAYERYVQMLRYVIENYVTSFVAVVDVHGDAASHDPVDGTGSHSAVHANKAA